MAAAIAADPLAGGLPAAAAADRLGIADVRLIEPLASAAGLRLAGGRVTDAAVPALPPAAQAAYDLIAKRLQDNPFDAPDAGDLTAAGMTAQILAAAVRQGLLLRLTGSSGPVVLLPDAPDEAVRRLAQLPAPFTVSDARGVLGTTRRVAVPLLEHLDATRPHPPGRRERSCCRQSLASRATSSKSRRPASRDVQQSLLPGSGRYQLSERQNPGFSGPRAGAVSRPGSGQRCARGARRPSRTRTPGAWHA